MSAIPQRKIRRKRLSEELTAQPRKYIIDNNLKRGDHLFTEQQMVERFGVSHTVVRKATKALDSLGIIDAAPRRWATFIEAERVIARSLRPCGWRSWTRQSSCCDIT